MMAGSRADILYMPEDAFRKATGTKDKELFTILGRRGRTSDPEARTLRRHGHD
jgi:hypothetical protein